MIGYDRFGNAINKTTQDRTEAFAYDRSGRFLEKQTNIDGTSTMYTYDTAFRYVLSKINPLGQKTTYTYNAYGFKETETDYLTNRHL